MKPKAFKQSVNPNINNFYKEKATTKAAAQKDSNAQGNVDQEAGEEGGRQEGQDDKGDEGDEEDEEDEGDEEDCQIYRCRRLIATQHHAKLYNIPNIIWLNRLNRFTN